MRIGLVFACVTTVFLGACNVTASYSPTVAAGKSIRLAYFASLNPDCSSIGKATVRVTEQASNGTVSIENGTGNSNFQHSNQRYQCNTVKSSGVVMTYTPNKGFVGSDRVSVQVIYASGRESSYSYNITVK